MNILPIVIVKRNFFAKNQKNLEHSIFVVVLIMIDVFRFKDPISIYSICQWGCKRILNDIEIYDSLKIFVLKRRFEWAQLRNSLINGCRDIGVKR